VITLQNCATEADWELMPKVLINDPKVVQSTTATKSICLTTLPLQHQPWGPKQLFSQFPYTGIMQQIFKLEISKDVQTSSY
jgi:hypothetical protein